jgi:hypothetical protein
VTSQAELKDFGLVREALVVFVLSRCRFAFASLLLILELRCNSRHGRAHPWPKSCELPLLLYFNWHARLFMSRE